MTAASHAERPARACDAPGRLLLVSLALTRTERSVEETESVQDDRDPATHEPVGQRERAGAALPGDAEARGEGRWRDLAVRGAAHRVALDLPRPVRHRAVWP